MAFAQPLVATMAEARPPDRLRRRTQTSTGAARNRFTVNTPAAEAGRAETMSEKSGFPLLFIPAHTPDARKPFAAVIDIP
jgi:hypothetical protein